MRRGRRRRRRISSAILQKHCRHVFCLVRALLPTAIAFLLQLLCHRYRALEETRIEEDHYDCTTQSAP